MADENYLKEVREHYENYPYPPTNPEDDAHRLYVPITESFDRLNYYAFEGKRNFTSDFRVLVAGGGTGDAAIAIAEQLRGTAGEVVYVDMSEASMAIAKRRAEIRGLTNIRWIRDSLLNIPALGLGRFDYINCSGVLHHLADPDLGLSVLSSSLAQDGAMTLMVYATYGRTAVYQMQAALRIVNRDEPDLHKRVANARSILNFLPHTNWFLHSPPSIMAEALQTDIGIYDLLLHAQDRSYTIPELYAYVGQCQLSILHFFPDDRTFGNRMYDPTYYMKDAALEARIAKAPLIEQQALAELLNGHIFKHTLYAAPTPRRIPDLQDINNIPLFSIDVVDEVASIFDSFAQASELVQIEQVSTGMKRAFVKTPHLESILRYVDGARSLRDIFRCVAADARKDPPNFVTLLEEFTPFYIALNDIDWMFLRCPGSSPTFSHNELQARVKTT